MDKALIRRVNFCLFLAKLVGWQNIKICIETGTYWGDSTRQFAEIFEAVHTIELSKKWFEFSRNKLSKLTNVNFYNGDSSSVLRNILPTFNRPIFFFLDAHFAGGDTALGDKEVPLLDELELICERRHRDILVIDDVRLIGKTGQSGDKNSQAYPLMTFDWRGVTQEKIDYILEHNGRSLSWHWGDQLIIFRNQSRIASATLRAVFVGGSAVSRFCRDLSHPQPRANRKHEDHSVSSYLWH
jgi:hypothetical protein